MLSGTGYAIIDDVRRPVKAGDVLTLPVGSRHTIHADTELQVVEVQTGAILDADDKIKY